MMRTIIENFNNENCVIIPDDTGMINFDWDSLKNQNKKNIIKYEKFSKQEKEKIDKMDYFIKEIKPINIGDVVSGTISKFEKDKIYLDVMSKYTVICDNETELFPELENATVGTEIKLAILSKDKEGNYKGSISSFMMKNVKDILFSSLKKKTPITVKIVEMTKGGYMADFQGIKVFMPFTLANLNKIIDTEEMLDKEVTVLIENYDTETDSFIVSHRSYLETQIPIEIKNLKHDKIYVGTVTGVTKFGIFVQFNKCLVGMIHKDNVLEEYKDKILEIEPGTEIEFYYKEIIKDRIILTQILRPSIWDTITVGDIYDGIVTKIETFGIFVQLDEETKGVVTTNELKKATKNYNVGDPIKVRVSGIIRDTKKIIFNIIN